MRDQGATVVAVADTDRTDLFAEKGIPYEAMGCHTATVEGYVVEGHVPAEAIAKLLSERPDAVGIAVPGMPADAPGMGGNEETWAAQNVYLIGNDGSLTPYSY